MKLAPIRLPYIQEALGLDAMNAIEEYAVLFLKNAPKDDAGNAMLPEDVITIKRIVPSLTHIEI